MALWRHPMYYGGSWWDNPMVPQRIFDQDFAAGMYNDAMREMRRMERSMNRMMDPYWMQPSTREGDIASGFSEV